MSGDLGGVSRFRDDVAIRGLGVTAYGRQLDRTPLDLAADAFVRALDDAGLTKDEIDGLVLLSFGADYDRFAEALGLDIRYAYQGWYHGRFMGEVLQHAALLVHARLVKNVAVVHAQVPSAMPAALIQEEMWRQGLGSQGESPAYGAASPVFGAAMAAQRYFSSYGGSEADLGPIVVALRNHAALNPNAIRRDPITLADHAASPYVIEPLRTLDCAQMIEGAVCLIVTTSERGKAGPSAPVYIMAMQGTNAGREYPSMTMPGLGVKQQSNFSYSSPDVPLYHAAGISQADVDSLAVYDLFSPQVLFTLERFGFCGPGESADYVRQGIIGLGGKLPVNTSGGLIGEGHLGGWNLFAEVVRQLRGECGDRQVEDSEIIQWANSQGSSILFRR